jgi:hypothetical protein
MTPAFSMQRRTGTEEASKARLFGRRSALLVCGAASLWFIGSSVAQIIPAVFGMGIVPLVAGPAGTPPSSEQICAEALRQARDAPDPDESALGPCSLSATGLDALAAFRRLREAREQLGRRDPAALVTLRLELTAHLPAEMR